MSDNQQINRKKAIQLAEGHRNKYIQDTVKKIRATHKEYISSDLQDGASSMEVDRP